MTENTQETRRYNSPFDSTRGREASLSREAPLTFHALVDLLETRISSDKIERDLLSALSDKTRKDRENRFTITDFISVCNETLGYMKEQISLTCNQLHYLLSEKKDIEKDMQEAARGDKHTSLESQSNDRLKIKVSSLRNLPIPAGEKVFIRISCDDIIFNTKLNEYLVHAFEEASFEFLVKTGLEKLKVEAIIPGRMGQEEVIGDFQILINGMSRDTEQDGWHNLKSRTDSYSISEVRLSLKLVSMRAEFKKYSTEEVEHKISNQTQEVETLERSLKNLSAVTSLLKEINTLNSINTMTEKYHSTTPRTTHQRTYSSTSTLRAREPELLDDRLSGSSLHRSEKKKSLPPLTFQLLANRPEPTRRNSEAKATSIIQSVIRPTSPGREMLIPRDFNTTPRVEVTRETPRNSLIQNMNPFNSRPKDECISVRETRATSTQRERVPTESDIDRNLESYRVGGVASKDQMSWKKENQRLNGMIKSLQEENQGLLKKVEKLKDNEKKVKECKEKMTVLIGELNRVQDLVREKKEEIAYWKQKSETNLGFDVKEVQGRIQKLVDENQKLREVASKSHTESVYYKKQYELSISSENRDKIASLMQEVEILRSVNQKLNQEQLEKSEHIEQLKRENHSLKENNKTFSNELAKRDNILGKLKREPHSYKDNLSNQMSIKEAKADVENRNTADPKRNQTLHPLQPWNFLNNEKGY